MKDLALAPRSTFASVRFALTDMDETLTYRGGYRLAPTMRWSGFRTRE